MSKQTVKAYAAKEKGNDLEPMDIERRELNPNDVAFEIMYCGICHSDLHQINDDWGMAQYPLVPGHEIVGKVTDVGSDVSKFKKGDRVAVGCFVDSCMECDQCEKGEEQFCREGVTLSFGDEDKISGGKTYGGFSKQMVTQEHFVLSVPEKLDLEKSAPILCAGITVFSPLKTYDVKEGSRVGVIGLGGLGHLAIKLAKAMGAEVTVLTRSEDKESSAKDYGADRVIISTDDDQMEEAAGSLDLILNTIPVKHDVDPYMELLDVKGTLVVLGQLGPLEEVNAGPMVFGNKSVAGSMVGGIKETQEVLDFCAEHDIHPKCEMIKIDEINDALKKLEDGSMDHRFVIDMSSLN